MMTIRETVESVLKTSIPRDQMGKLQYRRYIKKIDTDGMFNKRTVDDIVIGLIEYLDEREAAQEKVLQATQATKARPNAEPTAKKDI